MADPVTRTDLENAKLDCETIEDVANGPANRSNPPYPEGTVTTRDGGLVYTLANISATGGMRVVELYADLADIDDPFDGQQARVYGDPDPYFNGLFIYLDGIWSVDQTYYNGVAEIVQPIIDDGVAACAASAADAAASAAEVQDVRNTALVQGMIPVGWINPDDFDLNGATYSNDYGVKFFCNGLAVLPMMVDDATTLSGWRTGLARVRDADDGLYYVSVAVENIKDPTKQGTAPIIRYVNNVTGSDSTGDGLSDSTPWKTVEKGILEINAHVSDGPFELRCTTSTFFGGNNGGWNGTTHAFDDNKLVKIIGVGSTKPWWLPQMRNSYVKATFAWSDMGDGIWKTTAAAISTTARQTAICFDLGTLDNDGCPTPGLALTATYADEAAILVAMIAEGPCFHTTAANALYVKLASGDEPDPGLNFAYEELAATNRFDIGEGARLMIENFRGIDNGGASSSSILFFARPTTYSIGPAEPNVTHDVEVVFKDCESYGSSGNGFGHQSVTRFIIAGCIDAYCWLDGVNSHSLYTYPANSNSIVEGSTQHTWIDNHKSLYHGPNGFKSQPAVNASANTFTDHDRGKSTVLNSIGLGSNGSGVAIVGGAECLCLGINSADPKEVTPATDTYAAPYLASGAAAGDGTIGSKIWAIHCTGSVRPVGKMFYVGTGCTMIQAHFRGYVTKLVNGTGVLEDGYGNAL